jgi:hypothetical protein
LSKFDNKIKSLSTEIADLVAKKNKDYGDSFSELVDKYGHVAMLIRFQDKLNRLDALNKNKSAMVVDESMEDTIKDIVGYGLLALEYLDRKKPQSTTVTAVSPPFVGYKSNKIDLDNPPIPLKTDGYEL